MRKKHIIIAIITLIWLAFVFMPGYTKLHDLEKDNKQLQQKISELDKNNKKLLEEQRKLKEDETYIEKTIREEMGIAKEGEIIYKIEE